jgi:fumarate hydratase subunit beta
MIKRVHTGELRELGQRRNAAPTAGHSVLLSGTLYTARDAAHKKIGALLDAGQEPPFPLDGALIYYAGPTPAPPGRVVGSCGPTTSGRMDPFTPRLLSLGLLGMVGKGDRSPEVRRAIVEHGGWYFCAVGGAGALLSSRVTELREIAFSELGCESVKELTVADMPLIVALDPWGGDAFHK